DRAVRGARAVVRGDPGSLGKSPRRGGRISRGAGSPPRQSLGSPAPGKSGRDGGQSLRGRGSLSQGGGRSSPLSPGALPAGLRAAPHGKTGRRPGGISRCAPALPVRPYRAAGTGAASARQVRRPENLSLPAQEAQHGAHWQLHLAFLPAASDSRRAVPAPRARLRRIVRKSHGSLVLIAGAPDEGVRLDRFLREKSGVLSRTRARDLLAAGGVTIN